MLTLTLASVESRALRLIAAGWPWSREVYSLLADRLLEAGARGVVFDLLLLKSGPGDEALQNSIRRAGGRIIIGANFVEEVTGPGASAWSLNLPPQQCYRRRISTEPGHRLR